VKEKRGESFLPGSSVAVDVEDVVCRGATAEGILFDSEAAPLLGREKGWCLCASGVLCGPPTTRQSLFCDERVFEELCSAKGCSSLITEW